MKFWVWAAVVGAVWPAAGRAAGAVFWTEDHHPHPTAPSIMAQVAQRALPAVVSITTTEPPDPGDDASDGPQEGVGAGFILTPDGYVLTSAHVIDDASSVRLTALGPDGKPKRYPARVVGIDEETDFALLKFTPDRPMPVLPLGSARDVGIADWLVVIGSPFGLARSVSVGVVSYKGRTDVSPSGREGYFDYLQTDAAINPGNSGGPILDLHGDVVAVANAVNVAGQGIGFAVPVDIAKRVLPDLRRLGRVRRAWMGIAVEDVSDDPVSSNGVRISAVVPDSPASRAGLQVGDVIIDLGQLPVTRAQNLRWDVGNSPIGHPLELTVVRRGSPMRLEVVPAERPYRPRHPRSTEPSRPHVRPPAHG